MTKEKILIIILILLALAGLVWSASSFFSKQQSAPLIENSKESLQQALKSELTDKCKTPVNYSEEEWIEHMSHHPDRYAECL